MFVAVQDLQIMMFDVSHSALSFIFSRMTRVGAGTSTQIGHASSRFSLQQNILTNKLLNISRASDSCSCLINSREADALQPDEL